jgi:hypothetical protein
MANTTNFGWETPDDTDLVKDGAAAIRTLGSAIDTSLMDLEGGTTGQILAKNSNTDMDFVWVTNDVGDITEVQAGTGISVASGTGPIPVITNTVATEFDAKGDLVVGTGADTFDKLTVGANDTILVADSSTSTGLKWAAPAGGGGMTLLSTTTLSGASTTVSTIDQTYTNLLFVIEGATWDTANATPILTFNTNPTTYVQLQTSAVATSSSKTNIEVNNLVEDWLRTGGKNVMTLLVVNYASSQYKTFALSTMYDGSSTAKLISNYFGGFDSTALSSITLTMSSNRNQTGGTIKTYGVK